MLEIKETINYFLIKKKKNIEFDVINFSGRNIALNKGKGMFELMMYQVKSEEHSL